MLYVDIISRSKSRIFTNPEIASMSEKKLTCIYNFPLCIVSLLRQCAFSASHNARANNSQGGFHNGRQGGKLGSMGGTREGNQDE